MHGNLFALKAKVLAAMIISLGSAMYAIVLNEETGFSLGVIFAVFGGVWWLGRKLQNLEDRMDASQEWMKKADEERLAILNRISSLPCMTAHCIKGQDE